MFQGDPATHRSLAYKSNVLPGCQSAEEICAGCNGLGVGITQLSGALGRGGIHRICTSSVAAMAGCQRPCDEPRRASGVGSFEGSVTEMGEGLQALDQHRTVSSLGYTREVSGERQWLIDKNQFLQQLGLPGQYMREVMPLLQRVVSYQ